MKSNVEVKEKIFGQTQWGYLTHGENSNLSIDDSMTLSNEKDIESWASESTFYQINLDSFQRSCKNLFGHFTNQ